MKVFLKSTAIISLLVFSLSLTSAYAGPSLNLSPAVSPTVLREMNDGQWLFGIAKPDLLKWGIVQAGIFQAWNAEHGNASAGPMLGVSSPIDFSEKIGAMAEALHMGFLWKPVQYFKSVASINAFGGYRPIHSADVVGNWVYGGAATLRVEFGIPELQKGL